MKNTFNYEITEKFILFQVQHTRKPLASVSKIVKKGNRVLFDLEGSYIEHVKSGKKIPLQESGGTYHLDVEYLADDCQQGFTRQDESRWMMTTLNSP